MANVTAPTTTGRRPAPRVRLFRPPARSAAAPLQADPAQRRVVEHPGGPLLVLAGPGTGKTATVVELVAARVAAGLDPESVLVLTFSRRAAGELRDRLAARLARTTTEPLARTFHSYAFGLLRRDAVRRGLPEPRLRPAAEAELALRELLAGRRADAAAGVPPRPGADWPPALQVASRTAGFAAELHDLLSRAGERGLDPAGLTALAGRVGRPDWSAAADLSAEYDQTSGLTGVAWAEAATLVRDAVELLRLDPDLLARERGARRLVVVDEVQDCDPAQLDLLELVAGGGDLVAVGDPDQAIYAFRGSDRSVVDQFPDRFRTPAGPAPVLALTTSRRSAGPLLAATRRVADGIPGPALQRRLTAAADVPAGVAEILVHPSAGAERDHLAGRLRAVALRERRPWSQMAVIVRTGAQLAPVRRALRASGIPVTAASDPVPVGRRPAARDLLALAGRALAATSAPVAPVRSMQVEAMQVGAAPAANPVTPVSPAWSMPVADLLAGPFGGLDTVAVRRLRSALSDAQPGPAGVPASAPAGPPVSTPGGPPAGDGGSAALLETAFADPGGPAAGRIRAADRRAARLLDVVAAGAGAVANPGADPAAVLWALWSASGRAASWTGRALRGGPDGAVADRWLDAVVALFDAAERYVEEHPGAGTAEFLSALGGRELPDAAERPASTAAGGRGTVAVLTAHASKGLEWPVVAVVGVQERVWPDLRTRADLLGQRDLLRELDRAPGGGEPAAERVAAERAAALAEERRLFYVACTRASAVLLVSAVDDGEQRPSRFLGELAGPDGVPTAPTPDAGRRILDTATLVATLRGRVCAPGAAATPAGLAAARQLARLARAGVPGADPATWWGRPPLSDERRRLDPEVEAVLSPSRLEVIDTCPLRWFLTQAGGQRAASRAQRVGTLVHALAEEVASGLEVGQLPGRLAEEAVALGFGPGWADRKRLRELSETVVRLGHWFSAQRDAGRQVQATERELDHPVDTAGGRVRITGRVDLVDARPDAGPRVVDFKTGSAAKTERDAEHDPQLATYQVAVGEGRPTDGAVLVYLAKPSTKSPGGVTERRQPGLDGTVPAELAASLERAGEVVRAGTFQARPNPDCPRCPVRGSCPAQAAGAQVTA